eukprot:3230092-Rhodomonas_salina.1
MCRELWVGGSTAARQDSTLHAIYRTRGRGLVPPTAAREQASAPLSPPPKHPCPPRIVPQYRAFRTARIAP